MEIYTQFLEKFTHGFVKWTATASGFTVAFVICALLLTSGAFLPSQQWQSYMTAVTGIGCFLMIFLVQRSQNKGFLALQAKLNELIASHQGADNEIIAIESKSEKHIESTIENQYKSKNDNSAGL